MVRRRGAACRVKEERATRARPRALVAASNFPADGDYIVKSKAFDNATNEQATPDSVTVTTDTGTTVSAPDLKPGSDTCSSNSDDLTKDTSPVFSGTGEIGATVELLRGLSVVDTDTVDGLGNWELSDSSVPDGLHTYKAHITDAAGNEDTSAGLDVTTDTTGPSVTINVGGSQADPTNGTTIHFDVVFSESVSDFTSGDVTLGGSAGATTAVVSGSGTTYDVAVTGMTTSGTVIASIGAGVAHDSAGNDNTASTSGDNSVLFDKDKPTSTITFPAALAYNNAGFNAGCSSAICGTALDTGGSLLYKVKVAIQRVSDSKWWNGSTAFDSVTPVYSDATGTSVWSYAFAASNFPADGDYIVKSKAFDNATNEQATPDSVTFTIDTVGPTVTVDSVSDAVLSPGDLSSVVTWHANENGLFSVRVGGTNGTSGTVLNSGAYVGGPTTVTVNASSLVLGPNTIRICVTDAAGNVGSTTTVIEKHESTSLLYSGDQIVNIGSTLTVSAKLSSSAAVCVGPNRTIEFTLDADPDGGGPLTTALGSAMTNSSGVASLSPFNTTVWPEGVYTIKASFAGTTSCDPSFDEATLTIAGPGDAATGGGWYTLSGNGRVNFGFTVNLVPGTGLNTGVPAQYKGQVLVHNNGKWRLKGTLDSYSKTSTGQGASNGTGTLYWWDSSTNGGLGAWVAANSGNPVTFTISFVDNGQGGKNSLDKFGVKINYTPVSPQPSSLPNSSPTQLKGGDVKVK